jgi:hypothetical protein
MADCTISLGLDDSCGALIGGVAKVLVANWEDITLVTATTDTIDAVTMATTTQFYELGSLPTGVIAATAVATGERKGVQHAVPLVTQGDDPVIASFYDKIVNGAKVAVLIGLPNGDWKMYGRFPDASEGGAGNPLKHVGNGDGNTTGAGQDDFAGYNYVVEERQVAHPMFVDPTLIDALLIPAV